MKEEKNGKSILERITYAYVRRIKKWMFCPACQQGKMTIDKNSIIWTCENCGYELTADEFEDDYVFWFCDECNSYLNNQEGFDRKASRHICRSCGYENDTTFDNVKGICSDCGKIIPNPNATLCADCKQARKDKAKAWLAAAGKVAGVAVAVAGSIYMASKSTDCNDDNHFRPLSDKDESSEEKSATPKYKIIFDGEEDEVFDSEKAAEEYALYLRSCTRTGAETLRWSNPGDYDYDEETFEEPEFEIVEDN